MIYYLNLFSIVLAVSIDGFGVGMTYGMRKIKLSVSALLIIMLCSGTIVCLSMTIGYFISMIVSPQITSIFGSVILIMLGVTVLFSNLKEKFNWRMSKSKPSSKFSNITGLLANPHQADKDESGIISGGEAVVLGIALAMDAFGAGFAAAMLQYSVLLTSILVAVMSGLFLFSGTKFGLFLSQSKAMEKLTFLPPILLIGIGTFNILN